MVATTARGLAVNGETWRPNGRGDFDPCANLSWAGAELTGATAGRHIPTLYMLFHKGDFVDLATQCPLDVQVVESDGNAVTIAYPISPDHGPEAAGVRVTYTYGDGEIETEGSIPKPLLEAAHCTDE